MEEEEKEFVGARISKSKKAEIEAQLSYGDTIQDWLVDAIDRKLEAEGKEGDTEGNRKKRRATAD